MPTTDGPDVIECERCPALCESRSRIVNGVGPLDADLLFVGEGPGANEDQQGEPFVGRSGSVLDDALLAVGLERSAVRITNCVRCRPPENRDPTAEELTNCRDHLDREVAAVDPEVVVTLGKVPAEHLLDRSVAITSEAGSVEEVRLGGASRRLLLCLHPAATLYDRSQEAAFEETLATAARFTAEHDGGGQSNLEEF